MRFKPALRSRMLATGVSLTAFVAIVSGFIQESQEFAPEQSVKLAGAGMPLPPEVLITAKPIATVEPESTPSATASTSPTASKSPSSKPTKSASPNAIAQSPSSVSGVAPATPALPASPEVIETVPQPAAVITTCMSPGGNTREPSGFSCPSKWGYVLTQV